MIEELRWHRRSERHWEVRDGSMHYIAKMDKQGIWRVRMNNAPIGEKGGFASFEAVKHYVDWGGLPNRMGFNRETGEVGR